MISIANVLWRTVLVGTLLKSCRVSPCGHSRRSSRRITIVPAHALDILPVDTTLPLMHLHTSRLFKLPTMSSVREGSSSEETSISIVRVNERSLFPKDWVKIWVICSDWSNFPQLHLLNF